MTLGERLRAIHAALEDAGLPHAFGGAIALAYWTLEPRGTRDLDVNVFIPAADADRLLAALPAGVPVPDASRSALLTEGQTRLWWDDTPLDVFLDYAPIHRDAALHRELVPFEGVEIPVLGPIELAAFKAMFDRTKDWADIEAMLTAGTLSAEQLRSALAPLLQDDADPRWARLEDSLRRSGAR